MKIHWKLLLRRGLWLAIPLILVFVFVLGRMSVRRDHADDGAARAPAGGHAGVTAAAVSPQEYTCSMHPTVRSPDPNDKCPICGMDLIPVPADADDGSADEPVLRLSPRAAALMQVEVWPAERRDVHREVRLFGRLDYDETRLRTLTARYAGRLDRLHVNFTGTSIARDQPLAEIYSPALVTAQEELLQTLRIFERTGQENRLARESARATLDAARERLRLLGLTPGQVDGIGTQQTLSEHLTIYSPMDGVVTQRHATEGEYVETGQPIYSIADLSGLWANMEAYESDLAGLRMGDRATFTTQSLPGEEFAGAVTFIDPSVDPQRRTVRVRIDVPNDDGRLKPGMFVRGAIHAAVREQHAEPPIVIPATSPLLTGKRAIVYVQVPDDERLVFEGRQVILGPRVGGAVGYYVVRDGISEGDLVVVHGAFRIDSELQIRGRPSMMQPEVGRPPVIHDHAAHAQARLPVREAVDVPDEFRAALTPVYEACVDLQVALAGDDLHASREAARRLHAVVEEVDARPLHGDGRDVWRVLGARLRADAEHVDHLDIDGLRRRFNTWSNAAIEMSQRLGYGGGRDLVVAYCPMAFDDAGAHWLQVGHSIANPYFGAAMFRCGEVVRHVGEHVGSEAADPDEVHAPPVASSGEFLAALEDVYTSYFELQNSLAADDLDRSQRAALRFHETVRAVPEGAAPQGWKGLRERLEAGSEQTPVEEIEALRAVFEGWAMAVIELSRTFGHSAEAGHFVAHCPMAFDWRGASWLQADERINNPYFGAAMLRCGSIRERIVARPPSEGGNSRGTGGAGGQP